ncbi:MAG: dipicolinate synthase subunit DpsA [Clostridiales bacterium]|nr:MAG: dipicolinate synthase subunit DpsA [Clostridiales bacterium]
MSNNSAFSVIGGDLRQIRVANGLFKDGFPVRIFGFEKYEGIKLNIAGEKTLEKAITGAKYIILPLPCSTDSINLNAPFAEKEIKLEKIYKKASPGTVILGGKIPNIPSFRRDLKIIDYFEREELQILNAIPTAEGAIQTAMEEYPKTIHDSDCLIVGYGRIGKVLASRLAGLGAHVSVSARKYSDLSWISTNGFTPCRTEGIAEIISGFDIIFNTVPAPVIGEKELTAAKQGALFIDLASKPGGIDFETARTLGVSTVWSLSLPGKVAPITAGDIIKQTILNIISQEK